MFAYRNDPNDPRTDMNRRDDKPVLDRSVDPLCDGYARLSQADRQTGQRPYVGGRPERFGRRTY